MIWLWAAANVQLLATIAVSILIAVVVLILADVWVQRR